jgi:hypothetical protein
MKGPRGKVQRNGAILLVESHKLDLRPFKMRIHNQFKPIWGGEIQLENKVQIRWYTRAHGLENQNIS